MGKKEAAATAARSSSGRSPRAIELHERRPASPKLAAEQVATATASSSIAGVPSHQPQNALRHQQRSSPPLAVASSPSTQSAPTPETPCCAQV